MISICNLTKVFQTSEIETYALNNINLEVNETDFVSIMGPSGCGKSTLLNIIGLLDDPTSGQISINGESILGLKDTQKAAIRNTKIGFIFQSFHLIPSLNIIDNVELPLAYRKNVSNFQRRQRAEDVLNKVGLSHRMKHYPAQLSGGQLQRVAIARALVGDPDIILADEPTGNLDSKMGEDILELLQDLNEQGSTIIMVTHDSKIAENTKRTIYMLDGKIII